ncbi:hypothetical protein [Streptomyces scabiei]|uniref:hypothetical protein n=1 Tax=Streptomyces scabiei TaxID=1930 RepID=UPI0029A17580|nr:hypothetical protein [Streptomyces scabiei]MDX3520777.1 hypothetical protein [Streptomyces scabiei]
MSHTHDLAEWAAFLSLGVGVHATFSVFWFLLVDASRKDFHQVLVHAGYDLAWVAASIRHEVVPYTAPVRHAAHVGRELARDAAALLLLLTTSPKGQLR